jgi:putative heme transporter
VFARPGSPIGWRESYDISLAGVAASRVFSTAGVGGIALTTWALDRSGKDRRLLVSRLTTFYVLLYGIFIVALAVTGAGLRTGVLSGPAPFGLTVAPAIFGAVVVLVALAAARLPSDLGRRLARRLRGHEHAARVVGLVAEAASTLGEGVRGALHLVRTSDPAVVGCFLLVSPRLLPIFGCFAR